jgi:tripartite-type tricarboxylate transporter receptor subunit TctC
VIDNRPGAGGTIGTDIAAKSAPDGYTILAGSSGPISISPHVQKVAYDPDKDFEPIAMLASTPYILVVHPSLPAARAGVHRARCGATRASTTSPRRARARRATWWASSSTSSAKVTATHVPYKGSAQALTDVIAGHVTYTFETTASVAGT